MTREKITTHHTPKSCEKEIKKYVAGEPVDIYARFSYPELQSREQKFAEMTGTPDTALFNAGMAAIHTSVEAENLKPGDVVLCGRDVYSQTKEIYNSLQKRGIKIVMVDSGDMEEIAEKIKTEKPRLIILEDVANATTMQVNDIKKLIELAEKANERYKTELNPEYLLDEYFSKRQEKHGKETKNLENKILEQFAEFKKSNNPFIFRSIIKDIGIKETVRVVKHLFRNSREKLSLIVDNTLASPSLYNPLKELGDSDVEMVVVESATKHYQKGHDKITMGIAYSNNDNKIKAIKKKRAEIGSYLQPITERQIPDDITSAMPEIMKRHASNALELAKFLSGFGLDVSHPNLKEHKNSELVKEIAPEGLVTIFYINVPDSSAFLKRVYEAGKGKIGVGGSFGHKETWLLNLGENTIRIAAGSESKEEFKEVLNAFEEVIKELKK